MIQLREEPGFTAVGLTTRGPYWQLSGALSRLRAWLAAAALAPAGPPLGLFYDDPAVTPAAECRYTLAYPLDEEAAAQAEQALPRIPAAPGDEVALMAFPPTCVAAVEYQGPAADSPAVYARLHTWLRERGLVPQGPPRELYLAEPGTLGRGLMHVEVQQPVVRGE